MQFVKITKPVSCIVIKYGAFSRYIFAYTSIILKPFVL